MTTEQEHLQIPVRLDFDAHAADFARAMAHLDHAATKQLDKVEFDQLLRELVRIRASQVNGCAYCIDMHTKDARAAGESEQRLYALSGRRRSTPTANARRWRSPRRLRCWPTITSRPRLTRPSLATSPMTRSRRSSA
jgi:AhpD family alkylhydroperoxidase